MNDRASNSPSSASPTTPYAGSRRALGKMAGALGPLLALVVVTLAFSITDYIVSGGNSTFNTAGNAVYVGTQSVIVGTAALGMLLIIISGGIDLSVGNALAVCAVTLAVSLKAGMPVGGAVAITIVAGLGTGVVNGAIITSLRVVPFIVTLGTMSFYLGLAKYLADENTVRPPLSAVPWWIARLMNPSQDVDPELESDWLIPYLLPNFVPGVWLLLGLALLTAIMLHRTVFGRYIFAVGSNEQTARLCGVNVAAVKLGVYSLAGLFVGIAGVLQFARLSIGNPTSGRGLELSTIAAVVVGGASLNGGRGTVLGTLAGAVLMVVIERGGSVLGFRTSIQDMLLGAIIVVAAAIDQIRQRRIAGSA